MSVGGSFLPNPMRSTLLSLGQPFFGRMTSVDLSKEGGSHRNELSNTVMGVLIRRQEDVREKVTKYRLSQGWELCSQEPMSEGKKPGEETKDPRLEGQHWPH